MSTNVSLQTLSRAGIFDGIPTTFSNTHLMGQGVPSRLNIIARCGADVSYIY